MSVHHHHEFERRLAGRRAEKSAQLPRPLAASLPYVLVALAPLAVGATGLTTWPPALALSLCIAAGALVRGLVEWYWLHSDRERADGWIRLHPTGQPTSGLVAARMNDLTAPRMRRGLARSLRNGLKTALKPPARTASPMDVAGVRAEAPLIGRLADRLADVQRPVNALGIVLTLDLLTNRQGGSPLYERQYRDKLRSTLQSTLSALDIRR